MINPYFKYKKENIIKLGLIFLFFSTIFLLTRQVFFSEFSFLMNVSLFLFVLLSFVFYVKKLGGKALKNTLIFYYFLFITLFAIYSVYIGNSPVLVLRFWLIFLLLTLAFFVIGNVLYLKIFLGLISIQAALVISLEIYLVLNHDLKSYMPIRFFFLDNAYGDVYTFDGLWWKIQPRGNALLPFALFVSFIFLNGAVRVFFMLLFSTAIACAGNVAFLLGVFIFFFLWFLLINKNVVNLHAKLVLLIILLPLLAFIISDYVIQVIEIKSQTSNSTRIDQIQVLFADLASSPLFGQGFGNLIDVKTVYRDYSTSFYYEVQVAYIINQFGLFGFFVFALFHVLLLVLFIKYKILLIAYFSYFFYAFFNPYFFDTNHIVVIILLISLKVYLDERKSFRNYCCL